MLKDPIYIILFYPLFAFVALLSCVIAVIITLYMMAEQSTNERSIMEQFYGLETKVINMKWTGSEGAESVEELEQKRQHYAGGGFL